MNSTDIFIFNGSIVQNHKDTSCLSVNKVHKPEPKVQRSYLKRTSNENISMDTSSLYLRWNGSIKKCDLREKVNKICSFEKAKNTSKSTNEKSFK